MTKHGVSGNRESESGPTAANGPGATIHSLHGEESLKDAREVGTIDTNAVIHHCDLGSAIAQSFNFKFNSSPLTAVLHRVMDEVRHRLA